MEMIWKNFGVNSSKLNYPEYAVVIGGTKCLIVGRLNDSSLATYSELYSFLFIWKKFENILEKHERIETEIRNNFREYLKKFWRNFYRTLENFWKNFVEHSKEFCKKCERISKIIWKNFRGLRRCLKEAHIFE